MKLSVVLVHLICLPFAVHSRKDFLPSGRSKFPAEAEFWARVEREVLSSLDDNETAVKTLSPTRRPTAAPSARPTPVPTAIPTPVPSAKPTPVPTAIPTPVPTAIPTPVPSDTPSFVPSSKPSFSSAPSKSYTPTVTTVPTMTASPTQSSKPSLSISPTHSQSPTITASPTASTSPTSSPKPSFSPAPTKSSAPTTTPSPTFTASPTVSAKPSVSTSPSASAGPSVSASPTVSAAPSLSSAPTSSMQPTTSNSPSMSASPTVSAAPSLSSAPTSSTQPTTSNSPSMSANPTVSAAPSLSSAPTSTPQPTTSFNPTVSAKPSFSQAPSYSSASPTSTVCEMLAEVICISENNESCDFVNPAGEQCIGGNAEELRFIYSADSFCSGNNTQAGYSCVDGVGTDQPRPTSVYIKAFFGDSTFYEGIVNEGNVFSVFITDDANVMDVEIRELTNSFTGGELLQTMTMSVQCREEDSMVLLDTFGGLQLVGFRNAEEGLKSVYTDITIEYVVRNIGIRDLFITSAFKTTPISGTLSLLYSADKILTISGESRTFSEILTVNLNAIVGGSGLDFSIEVNGEDTMTGDACEGSDTLTLKAIGA